MSQLRFSVPGTQLQLVWPNDLKLQLEQVEAFGKWSVLIAGFRCADLMFDDAGRIVINHAPAGQALTIVVDDVELVYGNGPKLIPTGSLIEIAPNTIVIDTQSAVARWLSGYSVDLDELRREADQYPYGYASNALSVWNESSASPDYLGTVGRALYDLITYTTGQEYNLATNPHLRPHLHGERPPSERKFYGTEG